MSEEENGNTNSAENIHVTTSQNAATTGEWEMPDPVYRQTSGYLPQGFEKQFPQSNGPASAVAEDVPLPAAVPEITTAVEPQPDLLEALASQPEIQPVAIPAGRSPLRIVLIVLGLLAAAAIIIVFLAAVYLLLLAAPAETSF